jgi:exonuclease SbcC
MIIRRIKLRGIRSWEEGEVEFPEGFIAIVGPKGAGKSSLIDALEFALFGSEAFAEYKRIIRDGMSSAEVELTVEETGKTYRIKRGLTRTTHGITQDPSKLSIIVDNKILTRSKAKDLDKDVKSLLKVDRKLLEYTVLTRQEELKALLNMTPKERKNVIDTLLGLDAFEKAWEELGGIIRGKEGYLKNLEETAAKYDLEALSQEYDQVIQKIDGKNKEKETLEKRLEEEKQKLEKLSRETQKMEEEAKRYFQLKQEIQNQKEKLSAEKQRMESLTGQIKTLETLLEKEAKEKELLETQLLDFWDQLRNNGYQGESTLEALEAFTAELAEKVQELVTFIGMAQKTIEEETAKETVLSGKENCPYCGQPLTTHQAEQFRRERIEKIEKLRKALSENQTLLKEKRNLQDLFGKISQSIRRTADRLDRRQQQIQGYKQQITTLQKNLEEVSLEAMDMENQIKALEETLPPYDEQAHSKKQKELLNQSTLVERLEGDLRVLEGEIRSLGERLDEIANKINSGKEVYENLETHRRMVNELQTIRRGCTAVLPNLRAMYLDAIQGHVERTYVHINPATTFRIEIDENYTPIIQVGGYTRSYRDVSGGERTEIALAYRIGLGNAIFEARTGTPMELLILDEPTENLGNEEEDRSIENLAKMLSDLKVRQIITITHDQTFAKYADHTLQIRKVYDRSQVVT